jgi:hypothetical protein
MGVRAAQLLIVSLGGALFGSKHRLRAARHWHTADNRLIFVSRDVVTSGLLLHRHHLSGPGQPAGVPRFGSGQAMRGGGGIL